jgi:hypothetical protein
MAEARAAALDELVPKALAVLRKHLESDRTDACRPAVKVLEYAWGIPSNQVEAPVDPNEVIDLTTLSNAQLSAMPDRVFAEHPELAEFRGRARPSPLSD